MTTYLDEMTETARRLMEAAAHPLGASINFADLARRILHWRSEAARVERTRDEIVRDAYEDALLTPIPSRPGSGHPVSRRVGPSVSGNGSAHSSPQFMLRGARDQAGEDWCDGVIAAAHGDGGRSNVVRLRLVERPADTEASA